MNGVMTAAEYNEMKLLRKRWNILNQKWGMIGEDCPCEPTEAEFTLKEVSDISEVINTLRGIKKLYADQ
jgi:hypothetical protein